jgi:N-methylhydantoinase A
MVVEMAGITPDDVGLMLHGTTLATNAIIEKRGAVTALVTTEGFRDIVDIGYESRFDQYDLEIQKKAPLTPRNLRFGVAQRHSWDGRELRPLDEAGVRSLVPRLRALGVESVAVSYFHSYANPAHEQRTRDLLQVRPAPPRPAPRVRRAGARRRRCRSWRSHCPARSAPRSASTSAGRRRR